MHGSTAACISRPILIQLNLLLLWDKSIGTRMHSRYTLHIASLPVCLNRHVTCAHSQRKGGVHACIQVRVVHILLYSQAASLDRRPSRRIMIVHVPGLPAASIHA